MSVNHTPFIGTEAVAAGTFTRRTLPRRNEMLYRNVYLPSGAEATPVNRAIGAWLASGRTAVVAGRSASALHGCDWIQDGEPAELTRARKGLKDIVIHRERLRDDEVCEVMGVPTTTPARTLFDVGRRKPLRTALANADALANATGVTPAQVTAVLRHHKGARGVVLLRDVIDLMDGGAESPQETHTRLLLIESGMRRPVTQIRQFDRWGVVFARIDMGWPEYKIGVEYDGPQHVTDEVRRSKDIIRDAELVRRGWIIIRVDAEMLYKRPWAVIERVVAALRERSCPWVASVHF